MGNRLRLSDLKAHTAATSITTGPTRWQPLVPAMAKPGLVNYAEVALFAAGHGWAA